ncbi:hypothetical protein L228DRAFT_243634 [Xylona heveae TC161]|uniref:Uncharacterized protein n=1 Tax=Xylona heveae (strain CBS 132557 / TC161) TaxID=1328760 RepID=A0A165IH83_XYLHT|nr:hypothetical protein L228DRAFT_243634 [Xylona heveae TC161]KZF24893.1 hypothetical protein L228DRAFT_243634 [Xylona heveae TC161]
MTTFSASPNRTITCIEPETEAAKILANKWYWTVAKTVATEGSPDGESNIIWRAQGFAPEMDVTWKTQYALNWTTNLQTGAEVKLGGLWVAANKGEVWNVNNLGYLEKESDAGLPGWLNIGNVDYDYGGVGIHIVVGLVSDDKNFEKVFVDPVSLFKNSNARYQPLEKAQWWFEGEDKTGQVYSSTMTSIGEVDLTNPAPATGNYAWWTTYLTGDGTWYNYQQPPMTLKHTSATKELVGFNPVFVSLSKTVGKEFRQAATKWVKTRLGKIYNNVSVEFTLVYTKQNGKELKVTYGSKKSAVPGTRQYIGFTLDEKDEFDQDLLNAISDGADDEHFPRGETGTIILLNKVNGFH